mmetsp:Transcript_26132/g.56671  ORF Transcript_26132/g.56671 Transcript_26132/m.56671 type:complete len:306 (+) Transcript_26132:1482-2399(+)
MPSVTRSLKTAMPLRSVFATTRARSRAGKAPLDATDTFCAPKRRSRKSAAVSIKPAPPEVSAAVTVAKGSGPPDLMLTRTRMRNSLPTSTFWGGSVTNMTLAATLDTSTERVRGLNCCSLSSGVITSSGMITEPAAAARENSCWSSPVLNCRLSNVIVVRYTASLSASPTTDVTTLPHRPKITFLSNHMHALRRSAFASSKRFSGGISSPSCRVVLRIAFSNALFARPPNKPVSSRGSVIRAGTTTSIPIPILFSRDGAVVCITNPGGCWNRCCMPTVSEGSWEMDSCQADITQTRLSRTDEITG